MAARSAAEDLPATSVPRAAALPAQGKRCGELAATIAVRRAAQIRMDGTGRAGFSRLGNWWSGRGSNPRPSHCERDALPAELPPHAKNTIITQGDAPAEAGKPRATRRQRMRNWPATVIAVIAVILLLNYGAPFFIPLFVALLIAYALSPVVDQLTRVVRVRAIAAGVIVVGMVALLGVAAWSWSDDAVAIWEKVPDAAKSISRSVQRIARKPA